MYIVSVLCVYIYIYLHSCDFNTMRFLPEAVYKYIVFVLTNLRSEEIRVVYCDCIVCIVCIWCYFILYVLKKGKHLHTLTIY